MFCGCRVSNLCWAFRCPSYKLGSPLDQSTNVGPVISRASQHAIEAQVLDAISKGALDVTPANLTFQDKAIVGNYVAPRILTGATHQMSIMREETFGPIIPVAKVIDDNEAVQLMNDSDYGLTASVWTQDIDRGQQIADLLQAGTVFVNRCDYPSPVSSLRF